MEDVTTMATEDNRLKTHVFQNRGNKCMHTNYGEIRCPSKRPHFKRRKSVQIKEDFCDKLIGFVNTESECDVVMFCSSCKAFVKVENSEGVTSLEIELGEKQDFEVVKIRLKEIIISYFSDLTKN